MCNCENYVDEYTQAQELLIKAKDLDDEAAVSVLGQAIEILLRLVSEGRLYDMRILAHALTARASRLNELSHRAEAHADLRKALDIIEMHFSEEKLSLTEENDIAKAKFANANGHANMEMYESAIEEYSKAIEIWERLYAEGRLHDRSLLDIAISRREEVQKKMNG